jgi:hypothetical protein
MPRNIRSSLEASLAGEKRGKGGIDSLLRLHLLLHKMTDNWISVNGEDAAFIEA